MMTQCRCLHSHAHWQPNGGAFTLSQKYRPKQDRLFLPLQISIQNHYVMLLLFLLSSQPYLSLKRHVYCQRDFYSWISKRYIKVTLWKSDHNSQIVSGMFDRLQPIKSLTAGKYRKSYFGRRSLFGMTTQYQKKFFKYFNSFIKNQSQKLHFDICVYILSLKSLLADDQNLLLIANLHLLKNESVFLHKFSHGC